MGVEKSPQALHETFLEGNKVDAHSVVRHRVGLGLEAGAGQRLVDVLLQVVQRLLHRTKVWRGHQRGQLLSESWMAADDCGEDLDKLGLGESSCCCDKLSSKVGTCHLVA